MARGDSKGPAGGGGGRGTRSRRGGSGSESKGPSRSRETVVSKAASYLLRHGAKKEGVKMDEAGYVRCDDLLAWRKMRAHNTSFSELIEIVRTNAKQRFSLLYCPPSSDSEPVSKDETAIPTPLPNQPGPLGRAPMATGTSSSFDDHLPYPGATKSMTMSNENETSSSSNLSPHETALAKFDERPSTRDHDPSHYLIRATQGHSIPIGMADPSSYLKSITLDDESSIPDTVVHGTFYRAWGGIVLSGGLKRMGRLFVHFATGPSIEEVRRENGNENGNGNGARDGGGGDVGETPDSGETAVSIRTSSKPSERPASEAAIGQEKAEEEEDDGNDDLTAKANEAGDEAKSEPIRSGMRSDAQILIYLDIHRALRESYKFWISENGVVLCDGVKKDRTRNQGDEDEDEDEEAGGRYNNNNNNNNNNNKGKTRKGDWKKVTTTASEQQPLIPTHLFKLVYERKHGLGVLWEDGTEVQQVPGKLLSLKSAGVKGVRKGEGGGGGGGGGRGRVKRGKGKKPGLGYVETDTMGPADDGYD